MWILQEAEFWVAVGLVILAIALVRAGVPGMAAKALDARGVKIRAELDEALRLREEAQALLAEVKTRREEAERIAREMIAAAEADTARMRTEAEARLEEQINRRRDMAERKIANAEAQAAADVRSAAAELAAELAEGVLKARLASLKSDASIDSAISNIGDRFQ